MKPCHENNDDAVIYVGKGRHRAALLYFNVHTVTVEYLNRNVSIGQLLKYI